jgi:hypothetical protein
MKKNGLALIWAMAAMFRGVSAQDCLVPNPLITEAGGVLTLAETFDSYQWYRDGAEIPGAVNSSYSPVQAGAYSVRVSKKSAPQYFSVTSRSPKFYSGKLDISPNPSNGQFTVKTPHGGNTWNIVVVSALGETVLHKDFRAESETFDLGEFPNGTYFVRLTDGMRTYTARVIRQSR